VVEQHDVGEGVRTIGGVRLLPLFGGSEHVHRLPA
jgi:hypothetical protein